MLRLGAAVLASAAAAAFFVPVTSAREALTGSISQGTTWKCTGPVALDSVTVTIAADSPSTDAVLLDTGCTGTIGSINVIQYKGDGVKFGGASNLTIQSMTVRCYAHVPLKHQDGVQVLSPSHVRVYNTDLGCYSANNSQMWWNPAGSNGGATDVVFQGGVVDPRCSGSYGIDILTATNSGVQDFTFLTANAHPKREFKDSGVGSVSTNVTLAKGC